MISKLKKYSYLLLILTILLTAIGLLNLYSSSYLTDLSNFKKQLVWFLIGLPIMMFVIFINPNFFKRNSLYIYLLSVLSLVLVIIIGKTVTGSKSWFKIGAISIQPSEFAKIAEILIIARFFSRENSEEPFSLFQLLVPILYTLLLFALIIMQPDLGTGLIIMLIATSIFIFAGLKKRAIIVSFLIILGLSFPTWHFFLKDYQKERIHTFLDPSTDALGSSYNSIQSRIAVGSGKLSGKGFLSGSQSQLRFLPAQQTDFIFSVLAEEWGFLGSVFTLLIYFILILSILDTAGNCKDKFSTMVCFGIASLFFWHVVINIGMAIGLFPIVGVPLLLFSYGGSSVLNSLIAIGIVIAIKREQSYKSKYDILLPPPPPLKKYIN